MVKFDSSLQIASGSVQFFCAAVTVGGIIWLMKRVNKGKSFKFIKLKLILMLIHESFEIIGGMYIIFAQFSIQNQ